MKKLLLLCLLAISTSSFAQTVFINEIHYDNAGGDVNESVEIAGTAGTDLNGWSVVFYNGSNGTSYATENLTLTLSNTSGGYGFEVVSPSSIQNGSPDGVALINGSGQVVQFLSYEGDFTATNGPANGITSTDIGVSEGSSTPTNFSLQLTGTGDDYTDFTWATEAVSTFGDANNGQTFSGVGGPAPIIFEVEDFKIISNSKIEISFSTKLKSPLSGFNVTSTTLNNVTGTIKSDSILVLDFDPFTLGTTQNITISSTLQNIDDETLAADISETFLFNNSTPNIVITEINYNDPSSGNDELEFIELYNNDATTAFLSGFSFNSGIVYDFPVGFTMAPGEFVVLCVDATEFENVFGFDNAIEWTSGGLSNGGENIEIVNTENTIIDLVNYDDGGDWPSEADGDGPSLEIINVNAENNVGTNWRASATFSGVFEGFQIFASPFSFNQALRLPLLVVDFNVTSSTQISIAFSTSIDQHSIDYSELTGLGSGLSTDSLVNDSILYVKLPSALTIGSEYSINISTDFVKDTRNRNLAQAFNNTFIYNPSKPNLLISEILYNLPGDDSGLEFIELYNNSDVEINISGFEITEGIDHVFPVGTTIPAREFLLLGEDGAKLTQTFGITFLSWDDKNLNNGGELLQLENAQGDIIDAVEYAPSSPWPRAADGDGPSLEIINVDADNNVASNWRASNFYAATVNGNDIFASPGALEFNTNAFFYFATDSVFLLEGRTAKFQVVLKNADRLNAAVSLNVTSGDATEGSDFTISSKRITYTGGTTVFDVSISALRDLTKENLESFELTLQSPRLALIVPGTNKMSVFIGDVDQGTAEICINEMSREAVGAISPLGNDVPFIEFANTDFYGSTLAGYTLEISDEQNAKASINLDALSNIKSSDFVTLWLENDSIFDELITLFNVQSGELTASLKFGNITIQNFTIPVIDSDMVYARVTDCGKTFEQRDIATPNASNNSVGIFENKSNSLNLYPNPSNGMVYISTIGNYAVYNTQGQLLMQVENKNSIDLTTLNQGVYLIKNDKGEQQRLVKN